MSKTELINKAVKIGNKEGEITKIVGCQWCVVEYFNLNDGKTLIHINDIDKYIQ